MVLEELQYDSTEVQREHVTLSCCTVHSPLHNCYHNTSFRVKLHESCVYIHTNAAGLTQCEHMQYSGQELGPLKVVHVHHKLREEHDGEVAPMDGVVIGTSRQQLKQCL